jgi:hypothetical protein
MPKYSHTWDVDVELSFIGSQPEIDVLPFQTLSHKLAMLMALANADRCSDLVAMDLPFHSYQGGGAKFILTKPSVKIIQNYVRSDPLGNERRDQKSLERMLGQRTPPSS